VRIILLIIFILEGVASDRNSICNCFIVARRLRKQTMNAQNASASVAEHKHSSSCRKPCQGVQKCRMKFPEDRSPKTTVTESGVDKMDVLSFMMLMLYFAKDAQTNEMNGSQK